MYVFLYVALKEMNDLLMAERGFRKYQEEVMWAPLCRIDDSLHIFQPIGYRNTNLHISLNGKYKHLLWVSGFWEGKL
jgi:hypothetical protein